PATSAIPVVHLSATFVGPGHRALGLEGGADAYLTEPVEPPVLVATINALLRMRRAEETMRALARQWQATFDAIADGVALLNGAGTVLQCNRSFPAVLELASDDIIGRSIFELWRGTPVEREEMPFMRMVRSGHREQAEITFGSRWLQATADPVAEDSGRLIGAVYVVSDVTERKRADEDRIVLLSREQAARAQAEAASRAKDEFLATVSHELRAPLNVMLGWGRMLRSGVLDDAATRHALDTIERNIRLQAQLIDDLLDVSRITSGKLRLDVRPVDIPAVVQAALDSVEVAAEAKSIRIETVLAPDLTPILADPSRLQQIIWNLMSNAKVHADARTGDRGRGAVRRRRPHHGERQRPGHQPRLPAVRVRPFPPGRLDVDAAARRPRSRSGDRAAPGRAARWLGEGRQPGRGQGRDVHGDAAAAGVRAGSPPPRATARPGTTGVAAWARRPAC